MRPRLREDEILKMSAMGMTDKQIASHLGLKHSTIATYWKRIRGRMHVSSRGEAIAQWLMGSLGLYQRIVETIPDGVLIVDRGICVYANPAADRICETRMLNAAFEDHIDPNFRERSRERGVTIQRGQPNPVESFRILLPSGMMRPAMILSVPISWNSRTAALLLIRPTGTPS